MNVVKNDQTQDFVLQIYAAEKNGGEQRYRFLGSGFVVSETAGTTCAHVVTQGDRTVTYEHVFVRTTKPDNAIVTFEEPNKWLVTKDDGNFIPVKIEVHPDPFRDLARLTFAKQDSANIPQIAIPGSRSIEKLLKSKNCQWQPTGYKSPIHRDEGKNSKIIQLTETNENLWDLQVTGGVEKGNSGGPVWITSPKGPVVFGYVKEGGGSAGHSRILLFDRKLVKWIGAGLVVRPRPISWFSFLRYYLSDLLKPQVNRHKLFMLLLVSIASSTYALVSAYFAHFFLKPEISWNSTSSIFNSLCCVSLPSLVMLFTYLMVRMLKSKTGSHAGRTIFNFLLAFIFSIAASLLVVLVLSCLSFSALQISDSNLQFSKRSLILTSGVVGATIGAFVASYEHFSSSKTQELV